MQFWKSFSPKCARCFFLVQWSVNKSIGGIIMFLMWGWIGNTNLTLCTIHRSQKESKFATADTVWATNLCRLCRHMWCGVNNGFGPLSAISGGKCSNLTEFWTKTMMMEGMHTRVRQHQRCNIDQWGFWITIDLPHWDLVITIPNGSCSRTLLSICHNKG